MPCPYRQIIVGKRHCRVLTVGNIDSDATGFDIMSRHGNAVSLPPNNCRETALPCPDCG